MQHSIWSGEVNFYKAASATGSTSLESTALATLWTQDSCNINQQVRFMWPWRQNRNVQRRSLTVKDVFANLHWQHHYIFTISTVKLEAGGKPFQIFTVYLNSSSGLRLWFGWHGFDTRSKQVGLQRTKLFLCIMFLWLFNPKPTACWPVPKYFLTSLKFWNKM